MGGWGEVREREERREEGIIMYCHAYKTYAHMHTHARTHARTRTHTHTCAHACTHTHTHTHTHTWYLELCILGRPVTILIQLCSWAMRSQRAVSTGG